VLIASRKLQSLLETDLEEMRLETAHAHERAEEAVRRAAEANERAERERLARIQIEQRLASKTE